MNISAISNVHLLPEAQEKIQELSNSEVVFYDDDKNLNEAELIQRTSKADAILISPGTIITERYISACPSVKYIGVCGTATENVDLDAVSSRGITFTNVIDYGDEPTAEFIFMQLVYLARGMGEHQWREYPVELQGKKIGIIGLGALGSAIANMALAYKMDVYYYSRTRKIEKEQLGIKYLENDRLLKTCEILVVSTPTNYVALSNKDFELLHQDSVLVQASSGHCIDDEGFAKWIGKQGNLAIFDYSAGSENYGKYKNIPKVIFPKVIAGHTHETKIRLGEKVIKNIKDYINSSSN